MWKIFRNITKEVNKILPNKHKATLVYTGTKLGTKFNIKNIIKKEHKHDLVYSVKFPEEACRETYNGETGRLVERNNKHRRKDKNSHLHQLSLNLNHTIVTLDNFTILNSWYKHSKCKRNRTNKIRWFPWDFLIETFPASICLLKVNNRNTPLSGDSIVKFEHVVASWDSDLLGKRLYAGWVLSWAFLSFYFDNNFLKSNDFSGWVLLCSKYYWVWARIF